MKKFLALLLALMTIVSLSACGENSGNDHTSSDVTSTDESNSNSDSDFTPTGKILIAYFSATNNTERVAQFIADATNGTLFELTPVDPYTSADLNYSNSTSRVSREHNDESLRNVELTVTTPENWEEYDVVFIGYPIWWGIAAWPVNNFVKNNDFNGKTVIPFATSASSGLGQSDTLLKNMAGTGNWLSGQRFSSGASKSTVENWINGLNLAA